MSHSAKDEKIFEFFKSVLKSHVDETGKVRFDKLQGILTSLGRKVPEERIHKIRKKFDTKENGVIDYKDPEFLMTIASINVVDVKSIEDAVYSTAFRIFDKDCDGLISLPEMRTVLTLFLPVKIQQERELVETIIYGMDTQKDGEIRFAEFVTGVKEADTFNLSLYKEEFILAAVLIAGFILYQILKTFGFVPVIGVYEGPLGGG
eukprot:TRINITY_DN48130_c0_g1_i1.p1 TRINITY_DN48130_c0_g1~~TRINITY_DN48130_c0_g1_i1.p1  ORF type:complete len:205 (+),score=56.48 TRINITY_DN48130_c0_g1_i1:43-657(+)